MEDFYRLFIEANNSSGPTKLDRAEDIYLELLEVVACSLDSYDQSKAKEMLFSYFYKLYLLGERSPYEIKFINRFCYLQKEEEETLHILEDAYDEHYENFFNYLRHYSSIDARNKLTILAVLIIDSSGKEKLSQDEITYLYTVCFE